MSCKKTGLLSSSSGSQWGLIWSNRTVSAISAELLIFLQPDLIGWYIIMSWSALCKNEIVVFKVKITVKVQNFIESLCILYHLYHWSLWNQRRCADLLFIITKPSARKWHILTVALEITLSHGHQLGMQAFHANKNQPVYTKYVHFKVIFKECEKVRCYDDKKCKIITFWEITSLQRYFEIKVWAPDIFLLHHKMSS